MSTLMDSLSALYIYCFHVEYTLSQFKPALSVSEFVHNFYISIKTRAGTASRYTISRLTGY